MKVIITIPAFNEEKTLPPVIAEIKKVMNETKYTYQLLVYNDGSTDNTVKVAKQCGVIVKSNARNKGLATTFQRELEECLLLGADVIVHTDADGQYPAKYIPELIKKIEEGYDLVLGSRFIKKGYHGSWSKSIGNKFFAKAIGSLTKIKITDSTTGFRAFTKEVAAQIEFINTFTYTQEQIIKAAKQKFRIVEIPIIARGTRESRLFKGPIQYAIKAWINIIRIYRDYDPLKFFGKIGLLFLTVGILIGLWLLYLYITTETIGGHIALSVLSSLSIVAGLQIIFFGFLADMLKK